MITENELSVLQMEYVAIRQEIRDLVNSMDTNFNIAVAMIAGLISLAAFTKNEALIYLIPTLIFLSACVHILKIAAANVRGAYCQAIESVIKESIGGNNVMLEWEGGPLFRDAAGPGGIVQIGFYLFFAVLSILFCSISMFALYWNTWTIFVHFAELLALLCYAVESARWNTDAHRKKIIEQFSIIREERKKQLHNHSPQTDVTAPHQ